MDATTTPDAGLVLRRVLAERRLSVVALAAETSLDTDLLYRLTAGQVPRVDVALRIARALGMPVVELWPAGEHAGS